MGRENTSMRMVKCKNTNKNLF